MKRYCWEFGNRHNRGLIFIFDRKRGTTEPYSWSYPSGYKGTAPGAELAVLHEHHTDIAQKIVDALNAHMELS